MTILPSPMEKIEIELPVLAATIQFGELLGKAALQGDILCLGGDLGSGKTTLTQAIARGIPIEEGYFVGSPSFAILHEYPGRLPLYHMDFYRLRDGEDVLGIGLDDYFYMDGLTVIEWGERAEDILPEQRMDITLIRNEEHSRTAFCKYPVSVWGRRMATVLKTFTAMQ
ncbi:MAG TPA: tRNA (adenosine(37)-N6)-threonylcarbamoyltransferase complex ATPase subunit type 1 TsaE [Desulfopila sp.]|nr:tRNA (adenosine(37)-N6)-threonylcarbamoyltransferase complex ATPase subunit type 1 TsaE [Desulfopila sp.]